MNSNSIQKSPVKKYDAFISYRRDSGTPVADKIYEYLTDAGLKVFYDRVEFSAFVGHFFNEIKESMKNSTDILLIISDDFVDENSTIYQEEIKYAYELAKDNKKLIPIFANGMTFDKLIKKSKNSSIINSNSKTEIKDDLKDLSFLGDLESLYISDFYELKKDYFVDNNFYARLLTKMTPTKEVQDEYNRLTSISTVKPRNEVDSVEFLEKAFSDETESIDICAVSVNNLFYNNREKIQEFLKRNGKIRLIVNKVDSPAYIQEWRFKTNQENMAYQKKITLETQKFIKKLIKNREYKKNFKYKETNLFLPHSIFKVNKKNDEKFNIIKVDFKTFTHSDKETRCVLIKGGDKSNYKYFSESFDVIWEAQDLGQNDIENLKSNLENGDLQNET